MKKFIFKLHLEHLLLFVIFPISLAFSYPIFIKLALGFIALSYVIWVSIRKKYFKSNPEQLKSSAKKVFLKQLAFKFTAILILTSVITWIYYNESIFNAFKNNPLQYFIILVVYICFSVIPQEFVYRKFYFLRYNIIFQNKRKLIVVNTLVFSLGHLFFNNFLVVIITLIGGFIFSLSYYKFRSFKYICIEHSLYGLWLYTIGLGGLLGFPVN